MIPDEQNISILIGEDELLIAENLKDICTDLGYRVVGIGSDKHEIISLFEKNKPDIALLDIMMNGKHQGIEAAQNIRQTSDIPIIFITAFSDTETLTEALETRPNAYLIKPYDKATVSANIKLALLKQKIEKIKKQNIIKIYTDNGVVPVNTESILYIQSLQNYCKIHLYSQIYITRIPISKMETILPKDSFIRAHKSYIVNIKHISTSTANTIRINKQTIPIGRTYRNKVNELLKS